jgi:hypothetical protein
MVAQIRKLPLKLCSPRQHIPAQELFNYRPLATSQQLIPHPRLLVFNSRCPSTAPGTSIPTIHRKISMGSTVSVS